MALIVVMCRSMRSEEHVQRVLAVLEAALDANPPKPETREAFLVKIIFSVSCCIFFVILISLSSG